MPTITKQEAESLEQQLQTSKAPSNDLERAISALKAKTRHYNLLFNYYNGNHPMVYTASRIKEVFEGIDTNFNLNWCGLVIDSVGDRIQLKGFDVPDAPSSSPIKDEIDELVSFTELLIEAEDVHDAAMIAGESFLMVWKDPETDAPEVYYNDPRFCHIFYSSDHPKLKLFAAKWYEDNGKLYIRLYYPDRFELYESKKKFGTGGVFPTKLSSFTQIESVVNPYGTIPLFHFRPQRRSIQSDLRSVIAPQDAVNKLTMDMLVAAEFAAFRQRWVISNADITDLKNRPGAIMDIPAGDGIGQQTQVGEFGETNLENYLKTLDSFAGFISSITRTPKHYIFRDGQVPSGEALLALESPLVKKAQDRILRFSSTWSEVIAFLYHITSNTDEFTKHDFKPIFEDPESLQPYTQAQTRNTNVQAGLPLVTQLREEGWTQDRIEQMLKEKKADQAQDEAITAAAMNRALQNINRGGDGTEQPDDQEPANTDTTTEAS